MGIDNDIVEDLVLCRAIGTQVEHSGNKKQYIIWVQTNQLLPPWLRKPGPRAPGIYTLLITNGIIHQKDTWNVTRHHVVSPLEP